MKLSVVIVEGAKQIMMTPETDHEREVLKYISPESEVEVVKRRGSFGDKYTHAGLEVGMCRGDFLRLFAQAESLMFVIKDLPRSQKE